MAKRGYKELLCWKRSKKKTKNDKKKGGQERADFQQKKGDADAFPTFSDFFFFFCQECEPLSFKNGGWNNLKEE